jgi:hypothetical protein
MSSTTLTLAPWDAAIVLKQDGSFETSLPQIQGDHIPENVILGAALAFALRNEDLCSLIRDNFERECMSGAAANMR